MNFLEALKTGRPFRRPTWDTWMSGTHRVWSSQALFSLALQTEDGQVLSFSREELVAEDWEVKEPGVLITRNEFLKAWGQTLVPWHSKTSESSFATALADRLGL